MRGSWHSVLLTLLLGHISAMSHISIFQPEDSTGLQPVVPPRSFRALKAVALEDGDASTELLSQMLNRFIEEKGYHALSGLRGSAAEEAADFFDMVRNPDSTIVSSCDQSVVL